MSLLLFDDHCMGGTRWKSCLSWNFLVFSLILVKLGTFTRKAKKNPICGHFGVFFKQKKIKNWIQVSKRKELAYFFFRDIKKCLNFSEKNFEVKIFWIPPSRPSNITEGKKKPICGQCPDDLRISAGRNYAENPPTKQNKYKNTKKFTSFQKVREWS